MRSSNRFWSRSTRVFFCSAVSGRLVFNSVPGRPNFSMPVLRNEIRRPASLNVCAACFSFASSRREYSTACPGTLRNSSHFMLYNWANASAPSGVVAISSEIALRRDNPILLLPDLANAGAAAARVAIHSRLVIIKDSRYHKAGQCHRWEALADASAQAPLEQGSTCLAIVGHALAPGVSHGTSRPASAFAIRPRRIN